ncbi:polysaccharide biosynthesis protein [Actinoplanes derwentensis]|uniref:Membrane protein involved in the export of O-antigen and teichoic acid n=1 Tax=Actinoplanes derwentensis TaxID=113562 RepID=A0A1H2BKQ6_9ACTN|nr:polysaccharide biosynthesis protein [Actinoplanes derwentensis]GID88842.1 polysaccharide biosynthesis protein [Actinoplanes derwentensis]SDT58801.1 Membrane protein involved in the export of O-antigen and teichoic acid [Actinoplanes derwentensis]
MDREGGRGGTVVTSANLRIGVAAVAAASAVASALGYLVPVLGARTLQAADLGALATVLAIAGIIAVPSMGLQIAVAVHRAKQPGASAARAGWLTAAVCTVAVAATAPLAGPVFDLPAPVILLLAVYTGAIVLAGRWLGELQGDERFLPLAAGMAVQAVGRYGGLSAGLLLNAGLIGSMLIGTATALLIPPVLALLARSGTGAGTGLVITARQVFTACSATLAMLVVSYADLLLARALLPAAESGAYAVGTVLTKGAIWAPQVVTVLALPRLAHGSRRALLIAIGLVTASGTVLVTASAVAGGLAFGAAGGPDYVHLGRYAPVFAATGALYALVYVLINAQVAAGAKWPSAPLWAGTAVLALITTVVPHTFPAIMWSAAGTALLILTTLAVRFKN